MGLLFSADQNIVPHFLEAKTANLLHRKMHLEAARRGAQLAYLSIYFDSNKNSHIAWFYFKKDEKQIIKEMINDNPKE
jgi:hypothetical protein